MSLRDALVIEERTPNNFVAAADGSGFLFGGLTLGLALRAAGATVAAGMQAKSCHTYFVGAGTWGDPMDLEVSEETSGRTFSVRRVTVRQAERTIAVMSASFHTPGSGPDWQVQPQQEQPPGPGVSDSVFIPVPSLIEVRSVGGPPDGRFTRSVHPYWARSRDPLGEEPNIHEGALAFISDYMVILSMLRSPVELDSPTGVRTVDHSVWFHRPVDAEDWMLLRADPVSITRGRGLAQGSVHSASGSRLATFTQEVIIPS